jgi:hypothetical protein
VPVSKTLPLVAVVDDEASVRTSLRCLLRPARYDMQSFHRAAVVFPDQRQMNFGMQDLASEVDNTGAHGDVWRVQTGIIYSLF